MQSDTQSPPDRPPEPSFADAADVRAALARVLASRGFEQAGRSSEFLRFVVEETLAGRGDRLKGYTIAVEVFGRPADFDAQSDPFVRVEAGRLRRRLVEYYADEGRDDPLRLELPRGGYAIDWQRTTLPEPGLAATPDVAPASLPSLVERPRWRWRRIRSVLIAAVLLSALGVIGLQQLALYSRSSAVPERSVLEGPRIVVMPFENLSADDSLDGLAAGLTEDILLRLGEIGQFAIATPTNGIGAGTTGVEPIYILTGSVREVGDELRITARLVVGASGTQIWSGAFVERRVVLAQPAINDRLVTEIAGVAMPYGAIFETEFARLQGQAAAGLTTRDCVVEYYEYRRTVDPTLFGITLACFESAAMREPQRAEVWAGLALLYLDEHGFGYGAGTSIVPPLERAREAARRALDIDGNSVLAGLALTRVHFFSGDDEFERRAERTLALRPPNPEALAVIGTLWVLMGDPERGLPLVERAIALTPEVPGIYYVAHTLAELRTGRGGAALEYALRIDAPNWPFTQLFVAAAAATAGRNDVARRAVDRLTEMAPRLIDDLPSVLERWHVDPALRAALVQGVDAARLMPAGPG